MSDDLVFRLRKRAEIRRQISTRKSVQEGKADRIADLLEEAAQYIEDRIAIYNEDVVKVANRVQELEKERDMYASRAAEYWEDVCTNGAELDKVEEERARALAKAKAWKTAAKLEREQRLYWEKETHEIGNEVGKINETVRFQLGQREWGYPHRGSIPAKLLEMFGALTAERDYERSRADLLVADVVRGNDWVGAAKTAESERNQARAELLEAREALEAWSKWKAMETQEEQRPGSIGEERLDELLGDAVEKNWKVLGKKGTPQAFEDALRKQVQEKTYDEAIRCCDYVINLRSMFTPDFVAGAERVKGMLQAEKENGGPLTTQLNQIDKKT